MVQVTSSFQLLQAHGTQSPNLNPHTGHGGRCCVPKARGGRGREEDHGVGLDATEVSATEQPCASVRLLQAPSLSSDGDDNHTYLTGRL